MKCRVRRNKAFKPINVRLRFDNIVEYECFRTLMGEYASADDVSVPQIISRRFTEQISKITGIELIRYEVMECLKSIMSKIWSRLPEGREGEY